MWSTTPATRVEETAHPPVLAKSSPPSESNSTSPPGSEPRSGDDWIKVSMPEETSVLTSIEAVEHALLESKIDKDKDKQTRRKSPRDGLSSSSGEPQQLVLVNEVTASQRRCTVFSS